jgi:hypothetical protein
MPPDYPRNPSDGHFHGLRATRQPRKRAIIKVLSRWLITAVIVGAIYGVLFTYSRFPVISAPTKRQFNTCITGLSILYGISILSSLSGMVADLRWWILSRRPRSPRKVGYDYKVTRWHGNKLLNIRPDRTNPSGRWHETCPNASSKVATSLNPRRGTYLGRSHCGTVFPRPTVVYIRHILILIIRAHK